MPYTYQKNDKLEDNKTNSNWTIQLNGRLIISVEAEETANLLSSILNQEAEVWQQELNTKTEEQTKFREQIAQAIKAIKANDFNRSLRILMTGEETNHDSTVSLQTITLKELHPDSYHRNWAIYWNSKRAGRISLDHNPKTIPLNTNSSQKIYQSRSITWRINQPLQHIGIELVAVQKLYMITDVKASHFECHRLNPAEIIQFKAIGFKYVKIDDYHAYLLLKKGRPAGTDKTI